MIGRVTRYFEEKRYGFIRGEDNKTYFIHASKLSGEHIQPGYLVFFNPFSNDRSDYNAKDVIVIDSTENAKNRN
ncbi:'Cold-shock' DNA-binding domain-containing protein [Lacrimispora sphenoides]|jgi:cold shock CspA family protein|uniref:cold-shock protein n=1 Tax=Lacrimispora sphenoides TaxID=29370 RepID=UPI0008BBB256|nr:cold shock domain-containing protein [Lacrimispora sphenoides]SET54532.1 'Cold-shock' DNA-binding domain-containing protein [Lacrimispora sphenoides]